MTLEASYIFVRFARVPGALRCQVCDVRITGCKSEVWDLRNSVWIGAVIRDLSWLCLRCEFCDMPLANLTTWLPCLAPCSCSFRSSDTCYSSRHGVQSVLLAPWAPRLWVLGLGHVPGSLPGPFSLVPRTWALPWAPGFSALGPWSLVLVPRGRKNQYSS